METRVQYLRPPIPPHTHSLMPYIQRVAVGRLPKLTVHGGDYPDSPDGTAQRDYIHVVDLARGHLKALAWFDAHASGGYDVFNLGTGNKFSVLEVVRAYEKASGKAVAFEVGPRRPGDAPAAWADPAKAREVLGWVAEYGIDRMCEDSWRWTSNNPTGFAGAGAAATSGAGSK